MTLAVIGWAFVVIGACLAFVLGSRWVADRFCDRITRNEPPVGWDYDGL